jgi:hypothetical protein
MAGETTSLASTAWKDANYIPQSGDSGAIHITSMTATYSNTNQLETNDVMQVGYLPANITIYGLGVIATDMDTDGSPALVQKVTVGSTDIVTGITAGQSAGNVFYNVSTPYTTAAYDLVKVTTTTAAATGATGSLKLRFYYISA